MDGTDRYIGKRLKRWAELQQPPADGRSQLIEAILVSDSNNKENIFRAMNRKRLEELRLSERSARIAAGALLQPFILGALNVRPIL